MWVTVRFHERDGRKNGDGGLAHAHDVHIALVHVEQLDQVVDVVVEVEGALHQRHHARVDPVGDIDIVAREHGLDRAAQQRGEMARHRRHDQHLGRIGAVTFRHVPAEMDELTERFVPDHFLMDTDALSANHRVGQAEFRLSITARRAFEQLATRGHGSPQRRVGQGVERISKCHAGRVGKGARGRHCRMVHFV